MKQLLGILILTTLLTACSVWQSAPTLAPVAPTAEQPAPRQQPPQGKPPLPSLTAPVATTRAPLSPAKPIQPGERLVTFVPSEGIGNIAVQVSLPQKTRYAEGAGIVVETQTFATRGDGLASNNNFATLGLIHITYLNPGQLDREIKSDGVNDYGGEKSIQALRDVIRYAAGQIPDRDGRYLVERIAIRPLTNEIGLFAFSHPGIAAVNVLALHGKQLQVGYFVGRENPTTDTLTSVEVGYWDDQNRAVLNPLYQYAKNYSAQQITIDYSTIRWDATYRDSQFVGRPYFDLNKNGKRDETDHLLGSRIPQMFGKRFYSAALTQALRNNGALTNANWLADLATPEEAATMWQYRSSPPRYATLATTTPNLKVMPVFAQHDHVQPAPDKPHIHQAYDGFRRAANLWTRLNPDAAYLAWLNPKLGATFAEHAANTEPSNWADAERWAYPDLPGAAVLATMAAIAEMADRLHYNRWDANLDKPLAECPTPQLKP